jgi:capsid protein
MIAPHTFGRRRSLAPPRRAADFGYDAIVNSGKRRSLSGILRSEDYELLAVDRKKLVSGTHDQGRNFSVTRWMIERHLDYITTANLKWRSGDVALDKLVEGKLRLWNDRRQSDLTRRHSFSFNCRLAEGMALKCGDMLPIRLASGCVQWLEGDRVATPTSGIPAQYGIDPRMLLHGVQLDEYGGVLNYITCTRGAKANPWQQPTGLLFDQVISEQDATLYGFFDRYDQVRGVSPLACALNSLQDIYEAKTYALGRMKVDQLWAMAIYRDRSDTLEDDPQDYSKVKVGDGPSLWDLDPGDRAEFLQSSQPSSQFQDFMTRAIQFSLKALAIPFSFFDEAYTNYAGARQHLLQYEQSAKVRRSEHFAMRDEIIDWRVSLFVFDGELPPEVLAPQRYHWEWIAAALPWIDPLKEAQAKLMLLAANLESEINLAKAQGREFSDIVAERQIAAKLILDAGLQHVTQPDPNITTALIAGDKSA